MSIKPSFFTNRRTLTYISTRHKRLCKSGKYGVHLARFTHKSTAIIHASTKGEEAASTIRYLSLHDNSYLRYFYGHKKQYVTREDREWKSVLKHELCNRVTSLEMSPADDTFLSAAADDTVRLWDLRTATAQVSG